MDARRFDRFSQATSRLVGHPFAFAAAVAVVLAWGALGPTFGFSDTWQLVVNTGTTIVTFLVVFLIQNTQNREMAATQIKLDELIRATRGAHNVMLGLEDLSEQELEAVRARYEELARQAREQLRRGRQDTECVDKPGLTEGQWPPSPGGRPS
jgi:low affinity Fe/Cu permease